MRGCAVIVLVLLVAVPALAQGTPSKVELQLDLIEGYNHGLSGVMTLGENIAPDIEPDGFTVDLAVNYEARPGGAWTFRRLASGNLVVNRLVVPEWYLKEVQEYKCDVEKKSALLAATAREAMPVAVAFMDWLGAQDVLGAQPGSGNGVSTSPAFEARLALVGRLAQVILERWKFTLEAKEKEGSWVMEVIAFEPKE